MWTHSKIKGQFVGNYEYDKIGKRILILEKFNPGFKKIMSYKFMSWQKAKEAGWVKS